MYLVNEHTKKINLYQCGSTDAFFFESFVILAAVTLLTDRRGERKHTGIHRCGVSLVTAAVVG